MASRRSSAALGGSDRSDPALASDASSSDPLDEADQTEILAAFWKNKRVQDVGWRAAVYLLTALLIALHTIALAALYVWPLWLSVDRTLTPAIGRSVLLLLLLADIAVLALLAIYGAEIDARHVALSDLTSSGSGSNGGGSSNTAGKRSKKDVDSSIGAPDSVRQRVHRMGASGTLWLCSGGVVIVLLLWLAALYSARSSSTLRSAAFPVSVLLQYAFAVYAQWNSEALNAEITALEKLKYSFKAL